MVQELSHGLQTGVNSRIQAIEIHTRVVYLYVSRERSKSVGQGIPSK